MPFRSCVRKMKKERNPIPSLIINLSYDCCLKEFKLQGIRIIKVLLFDTGIIEKILLDAKCSKR